MPHLKKCPHCGIDFETPRKAQIYHDRKCAARAKVHWSRFNRKAGAKSGRRRDLGDVFFRSAWEANYARYLNIQIEAQIVEDWEFEPRCFWFPYKKGNNHYTPDFRVTFCDGRIEWHEIKGYLDDASKVKIKRFRKFYPEETLVIIGKDEYKAIKDLYAEVIAEWE